MAIYKISESLLFPWMKSTIGIDDNLIQLNQANSVLGIIPLGYIKQNIPINNISASMVYRHYNFIALLIGLIFMGLGIIGIIHFIISFYNIEVTFLLPLGLYIFLRGITSALIIQRSGDNYCICTPFYEQKTLNQINDELNKKLIQRAENTDLSQFFDKKSK